MSNNIPPFELQMIIAHILGVSREYVLAHPEIELNSQQKKEYQKLIAKRLRHEPMAYILGHKEFYGLDFKVNKHTLIPRPETELLVELVLEELRIKNQVSDIIDVGTGSGNIIISLARNTKHETRNKINFYGIDISPKALSVAKQNAKAHKVDKKIRFIKSDLLEYFWKNKNSSLKIDNCKLIIVSNLPYLSEKIYSETLPDVKNFEPKSALVSGPDGLDHYKKLFQQILGLKKSCFLFRVSCFVEISPEQKSKIGSLIKKYFPDFKPEFKKDLAGKWRVVFFEI